MLRSDFFSYKTAIILAVLIVSIGVWQYTIYKGIDSATYIGKTYARTDATGLNFAAGSSFTYFYYYLGLYPLAVLDANGLDYSKNGAIKALVGGGVPLALDNSFYILWGEHGKSLLLLLDAAIKNSPEFISVRDINFLFFVLALAALAICSITTKQVALGISLVILVGSNPFLIYELYGRENIFGLGAIVLIAAFSLLMPIIFLDQKPHRFYLYGSAIFLGVMFGFIQHTRSEYTVVILSCLFVYWVTKHFAIREKLTLTALLLVSLYITTAGLEAYFTNKLKTTYTTLSQLGLASQEQIATAGNATYHTFWHPFYIGLSDFDDKYGIQWSDKMAYDKAEKYLMTVNPEKFTTLPNIEMWSVQPEYNAFIRSEIIKLISHDPLWYARIVLKRVGALFGRAAPLGLQIGPHFYKLPFSGWLFFPILAYLIWKKDVNMLTVAIFPLTLSLPIILIHASRGITNMSLYHVFGTAIVINLAVNCLKEKLKT